jgi:acetylglutamate/LysW-gamma-L-alpha-aminoadipate kinase
MRTVGSCGAISRASLAKTSGKIERVNAPLLRTLVSAGYVPVVAPLAVSFEGEALNVDGDRVAAAISSALKAQALIILSNVPGLMRRFPDESTIIPRILAEQAPQALDLYAQGRMKKKVLGAIEALNDGVGSVVIADGRVPRPVYRALDGQGTVIQQAAAIA